MNLNLKRGKRSKAKFRDEDITVLPEYTNVKKKRSCLMCGEIFDSKGVYNRRCPKCDRLIELKVNGGFREYTVYHASKPLPNDVVDSYIK
ncbi:MAG: hypothetical protein ACUZ8O_06305 [Candidatus Anammoxibacter sp.]